MSFAAWKEGRALREDELAGHLGPGLSTAQDAPPLPAHRWNPFAFALARRLLRAWVSAGAREHEAEWMAQAVAAIGAADALYSEETLRGDPDARTSLAAIEATVRPLEVFCADRGAAVADATGLLVRLFRWGTRRARRDRVCPDALADLAEACVTIAGDLAALAGEERTLAENAERTAQRDDALAILSGQLPLLARA